MEFGVNPPLAFKSKQNIKEFYEELKGKDLLYLQIHRRQSYIQEFNKRI